LAEVKIHLAREVHIRGAATLSRARSLLQAATT